MPSRLHNEQKSPQKRFLLILRAAAFFAAGVAVIFWDKILPDYGYKKILFGGLIIVYSVVRFVLALRKDEDNEE